MVMLSDVLGSLPPLTSFILLKEKENIADVMARSYVDLKTAA